MKNEEQYAGNRRGFGNPNHREDVIARRWRQMIAGNKNYRINKNEK